MAKKTFTDQDRLENSVLADITSPQVQEVISRNPGFIVRRGNAIVALVVFLLFGCSWYIKYPDTVSCVARLTTTNAAKPIVAKQSGKLTKLNVTEGQTVQQDDVIGYLESPESAEAVLTLEEEIKSVENCLQTDDRLTCIKAIGIKDNISDERLGKLQGIYQKYCQAHRVLLSYLDEGFYVKKLAGLQQEMLYLKSNYTNLQVEKQLHIQNITLSESTMSESKKMLQTGEITQEEFRRISSDLIEKKLAIPQINSLITDNLAKQTEKQQEITELQTIISNQIIAFRDVLNGLKTDIQEWKNNFLFTAPVTGRVTLASYLQVNQQLQSNQNVAHIVPVNNHLYMQMMIPQKNFGKVAIGQKVLLKFNSYNWQEYGAVEATIEHISPVPTDTIGYMAKLRLSKGLVTTYKKIIPYREGLIAHAEVITSDKTLIARLFNDFAKIN